MRTTTILLALLIATSSYAQTIKGQITTQEEKEGLPFAQVILERNGNFIAETNTDIDGNYKFTIDAGTYDLRVKYIGYRNSLVQGIYIKEKETTINVIMNEGPPLLADVPIAIPIRTKKERKKVKRKRKKKQ